MRFKSNIMEEKMKTINEKAMSLQELIAATEQYFRELNYSPASVREYRKVWGQFLLYASERNVTDYSTEFAMQFLDEHYGIKIEGQVYSGKKITFRLRSMNVLSEFQLHGSVKRKMIGKCNCWPAKFEKTFSDYMHYYAQRVKLVSVKRTEPDLKRFADYIDNNGIENLNQITASTLQGFIMSLQQYTTETIGFYLSRIRHFLRYAHSKSIITEKLEYLVPHVRHTSDATLPTTYTQDEIARLLSVVDRANPVGKRDYAILLLAVKLGIRACDIRSLKFPDIKWESNQIQIIQAKTGNPLYLPLLSDVGEAIIDYIQNGRPQAATKFIFVRHIAPFEEFEPSNPLHYIMKKYWQMAKLPGETKRRCGLHSLRHSLASTLLENEIPLPIISEILGHVHSESTTIYTKIDIQQLRKCAIDIPSDLEVNTNE